MFLLLVACDKAQQQNTPAPTGATGSALRDALLKTVDATTQAALHNARPVAPAKLGAALPAAIKDLPCSAPELAESPANPVATQATRVCQAGERKVTLALTDHVLNQAALMPMRGLGTQVTDDGASRYIPYRQGDVVGIERVAKQGLDIRFELLLKERFLLTVEGSGITRDVLAPLVAPDVLAKMAESALR